MNVNSIICVDYKFTKWHKREKCNIFGEQDPDPDKKRQTETYDAYQVECMGKKVTHIFVTITLWAKSPTSTSLSYIPLLSSPPVHKTDKICSNYNLEEKWTWENYRPHRIK